MTLRNTALNLPWLETPFFQQELANAKLSPELTQLASQFAEEGYIIIDPEIAPAIIDEALAGAAPLYNGQRRLPDAWHNVPAIQQIATASRVMEILRTLYRREPIPFQTLNFPVGTEQKTHSDAIHFHSIPQRFMCGVWIAFEDIHDNNGPLHYYPGSHKLPIYELVDMGLKGSDWSNVEDIYQVTYKLYEDYLAEIIEAYGLQKKTLNLSKGQALIWSANLLHGGEPILQAGASRHSQVTHYFFEDCAYYIPLRSDAALDKLYFFHGFNIATGKRITNKYFNETLQRYGYSKGAVSTSIMQKIADSLPSSLKQALKSKLKI